MNDNNVTPHNFTIGDTVRVLSFIGKEFEDDKIGTIRHRDGAYIYIRLLKSKVEIERYPNEIELYEN